MLTQQSLRKRSYNEVVFDSRPIVADPPMSLEAFFLPADGGPEARDWIKRMHRRFLDEYGVSTDDVPILTYTSWYGKQFAGDPFSVPSW